MTAAPGDDIAERLIGIQARISAAAERARRAPGDITLVGVAKTVPAERIAQAVASGLRDVGESYLAEAKQKNPALRAALAERGVAAPRHHFIGRLQRNKARGVAEGFDCVHSLDRKELCDALGRHASAAGRSLELLVQVNVAAEPQKGGVAPGEVGALLRACRQWPALRAVGLMAIPPDDPDPERARKVFATLRELRDALRATPEGASLRELSMGMSGDFEVAIEEGATMIRVGTAIFGPRER